MVYIIKTSGKLEGPVTPREVLTARDIVGLILTDNNTMHYSLTGFDGYLYEEEAITGIGVNTVSQRRGISRQTIIGYYNTDEAKSQLLNAFNKKLKQLIDNNEPKDKMDKLREQYEFLLDAIKQKECVSYSLHVASQVHPSKHKNYNIVQNQKIGAEKFLGKYWSRFKK